MSANSRISSRCSMARAKGAGGCDWTRSRLGLKSWGSTPTIRVLCATFLAAAIGCVSLVLLFDYSHRAMNLLLGISPRPTKVKPYPNIYCGTICHTAYPFLYALVMVALDGSWNMDLEDVAPVAILEWIGVELGIAQRERVMPSAQSRGGGRTLI